MSSAQHPDRYVWDFWYVPADDGARFHVLYLNSDHDSAARDQHHFVARLGYAVTRDFVAIDWVDSCVFRAKAGGWDNSSIWSGDLIRVKTGHLLFYTSRDQARDDGMTQSIGAAFSDDLRHWRRIDGFRLDADPRFYDVRSRAGDTTIHAWRDPFLFRHGGAIYMLVSAKSPDAPLGRNGAVALLKAVDNDLFRWEALPPLAAPGWYSEMEVPQIHKDRDGRLMLVYSGWARFDHAPGTDGQGGFQALRIADDLSLVADRPTVLLPEAEGLYACRIVPELEGDIVGFDLQSGGIGRAFRPTYWRSVSRDFTDFSVS